MFEPTLLIDGYKLDHRRQYPPGTEFIYSNFTPRSSRVPGQSEVVFLGLQYFLQRYLDDGLERFFEDTSRSTLQRYQKRIDAYLGPNSIGTDHIRAWQDLGYTPLRFRAVPEGICVPVGVPMFTVENTHAEFAWLVNYYETLLSSVLWMPCTSATSAYRLRRLLDRAAWETGSPLAFVDWQGHDFSFRGMPGLEAAALSGMGHLLFFRGTDTLPALDLIEEYYPPTHDTAIGGSVAATEHSVMCAGGAGSEEATFARLLDLYPSGIVSVVSDTWDLWHVLTELLPTLRERILARDGKLVIRPDSGDPVKIVCGDPAAAEGSPARKGVIELLWDLFGGSTTATGFRLLDPHIGCLYGDAISYDRATAILLQLEAKRFASGNIVFGVGSYTYQYVTRDTYNFAMKATWAQIYGVGMSLFKKPVTDSGMKYSARGRLAVVPGASGRLELVEEATPADMAASVLRTVWEDGYFARGRESFDTLRARAGARGV